MAICPHCQTPGNEFLAPCSTGDGYFCIEEEEFRAHAHDRLLGQQIAGRFIVVGVIGHGSMGYVYRAIQGQVDRSVALKIFRPDYLATTGGKSAVSEQERLLAQQRFVQEARVLGSLSHPNCVTLYDFGFSEQGDFLYIAMEYVGGISLRRAVRRGVKLEPILEITRQILLALREAHALDIVHRDLKPENIMIAYRAGGDEPIVKVLDFGIAKLLGQENDTSNSTGLLFGTPAYMSPEQCRGDMAALGAASDIYALGCMLYEMICGQLPYPSNVPQEMVRMHLDAPIPALTPKSGLEVPLALELFIKKCMAKNPAERYPNARVALRAFEEAVDSTEASSSTGRAGSRSADSTDTGSRKVIVPQNRISGMYVDPWDSTSGAENVSAESVNSEQVGNASASLRLQRPEQGFLRDQSAVATVYGDDLEKVNLTPAKTLLTSAEDRAEQSRTVLLLIALVAVLLLCVGIFYSMYKFIWVS